MASAPRERRANRPCCREGLDGLSALNHDLSITPRQLKAGFALRYGEVSYGNIGAGNRLDFTVIGPDVNLTSRIERLCRELARNLIMSEDFVQYLDSSVIEIGHFRLRGFSRMQLLFGLPTASTDSTAR
jgi:class 3 adenylate cyclase